MKVVVAAIALSVCTGVYAQTKQTKIPIKIEQAAKTAIKDNLKDPASAIFGEMFSYVSSEKKRYVCGIVNAKNSYGGYTGGTGYLTIFLGDKVEFTYIDKANNLPSVAFEMCSPEKIEADIEKYKTRQLAESKATCRIDWDASTAGACGDLYKQCNDYLKFIGPGEKYEFMTHCRINGYDSATQKWYTPKPIEFK